MAPRILIGAMNVETGLYHDLVNDKPDHAKIIKNHVLANRDLFELHFYGQPKPVMRSAKREDEIVTSHDIQAMAAAKPDPILDPTVDEDEDDDTMVTPQAAGLEMPGIPDFQPESLTRLSPPPAEQSSSVKVYTKTELKDMPDEGLLDLLCMTYKKPVPDEKTKRSDMISMILEAQAEAKNKE